jgi:hypothetical protein
MYNKCRASAENESFEFWTSSETDLRRCSKLKGGGH